MEDDAGEYRRKHNVTDLESCYDWSTVSVGGNQEVDFITDCVYASFVNHTIENEINFEGENTILAED